MPAVLQVVADARGRRRRAAARRPRRPPRPGRRAVRARDQGPPGPPRPLDHGRSSPAMARSPSAGYRNRRSATTKGRGSRRPARSGPGGRRSAIMGPIRSGRAALTSFSRRSARGAPKGAGHDPEAGGMGRRGGHDGGDPGLPGAPGDRPGRPAGPGVRAGSRRPQGEGAQALGEQPAAARPGRTRSAPSRRPNSPPTPIGQPTKTASGLVYETLKEGTGPAAKSGQTVTIHYTGTLTDGTVFDSSRENGKPFHDRHRRRPGDPRLGRGRPGHEGRRAPEADHPARTRLRGRRASRKIPAQRDPDLRRRAARREVSRSAGAGGPGPTPARLALRGQVG